MTRVTGIGGIFFKAEDPGKLRAWYERHLGVTDIFHWNVVGHPSRQCYTAWNVFLPSAKIFEACTKEYVFTYCVDDLVALLTALKTEGIRMVGVMETDESGKFVEVLDLEDNKIVLWEPSNRIPPATAATFDRVTGLGGVFFKANDKKKLLQWYGKHLGFSIHEWGGATFQWIDPKNPGATVPAGTAWSPFDAGTTYFQPSQKQFMFNYRVKDLVWLLKVLKDEGVEIAGKMEEFSYGKFGWIVDPEKNKIELWEPKDDGF